MILEALGILKILDWATAGDRQQCYSAPPPRPDSVGDAYDVEGGEMRIVARWYRGYKQYYVEGRLTGTRKWVPMWWHCGWSCIPEGELSDNEIHKEFHKMLNDPDVLKPLKEKPCG
jgi:hypothetical protein